MPTAERKASKTSFFLLHMILNRKKEEIENYQIFTIEDYMHLNNL